MWVAKTKRLVVCGFVDDTNVASDLEFLSTNTAMICGFICHVRSRERSQAAVKGSGSPFTVEVNDSDGYSMSKMIMSRTILMCRRSATTTLIDI